MTRRHIQFLHSLTEAFPASIKVEGVYPATCTHASGMLTIFEGRLLALCENPGVSLQSGSTFVNRRQVQFLHSPQTHSIYIFFRTYRGPAGPFSMLWLYSDQILL
jgi:hypothetical protein